MDQLFQSDTVLQRLRRGPFAQYLPQLNQIARVRLEEGYTHGTLQAQICRIALFGEWLETRGLAVSEVEQQTLRTFRGYHPASLGMLKSLIERLCAAEVIPRLLQQTPEETEVDRVERGFKCYLSQERGLAPLTLAYYLPYARQFLLERFAKGAVLLYELNAQDLINFILRHAHDQCPGRSKLMVAALRAFMRYLFLKGDTSTDLAPAIPTVADWRLETLPRGLEAREVGELLRCCDSVTSSGKRDYAILILLARLGLRAHEVTWLQLDDIDWEAGTITICGKGRRSHRLPMPHDVGEAIVDYLLHGRPTCSTRRVFVRTAAPHTGFATSHAVGSVVARALHRAGLTPRSKGAHLLRHALATQMLRSGSSLTEIGQLLRHRHQDTTAIYAKVDMDSLRSVAQRWPGGAA